MEILKYFLFLPEIQAITEYLEGEKSLSLDQVQEI